VCGKGLIVSVEVLADDYLMSTWQQQKKKVKEYCFLKILVGILLPEN
jgi:hypothetical protein